VRGVIGDDEVEDGLDSWNSWRSFWRGDYGTGVGAYDESVREEFLFCFNHTVFTLLRV